MAKETKKTEDKKACPISAKLCKCCDTFKSLDNKKKAIIAASIAAVVILLMAIFCCGEQVKYHVSSKTIVKEVINGNKSEYFFCKRDFPEGEIKESAYYVVCDKQLIEN
tara:strand:+ start:383 stop:709 length:327 start_codon:yes stop_codon:yes gene_type:complete